MAIPQIDETWPSLEELEAFARIPERPPLTLPFRAVLGETAVTGMVRYDWQLLKPLISRLLQSVVEAYVRETARPVMANGATDLTAALQRLHSLLDAHTVAPFTLQRLCELLLEPQKQYHRADKLMFALEKLLIVTSGQSHAVNPPPPPPFTVLSLVNENPPSSYLSEPVQFAIHNAATGMGHGLANGTQALSGPNGVPQHMEVVRADDGFVGPVLPEQDVGEEGAVAEHGMEMDEEQEGR